LFTEVLAMVATYTLHGRTITALLASGIVGILVTAGLYVIAHPEQFEYLKAAKVIAVEQLKNISASFNRWGKSFMNQQPAKLELVSA